MKDPNLRMVWASDVWSWPKMQGQVIDLDDFDDQANLTDIDCDQLSAHLHSLFQPQLSLLIPDAPLFMIAYDPNTNSPIIRSDCGSAPTPLISSVPLSRQASQQSSLPIPHLWDSVKQKHFETWIACLTASAGLPLALVDNIKFIVLISEFIPTVKPPSWKVLTKWLISATIDELHAKAKSSVSCHEATIEADGWTSQNNHHPIAMMITVHSEASLILNIFVSLSLTSAYRFTLSTCMVPHENERLLKIYLICSKIYPGCWAQLGCSGCGCSHRCIRRVMKSMGQKFSHIVVLDCYAHQVWLCGFEICQFLI